jgi:hypothetical protein
MGASTERTICTLHLCNKKTKMSGWVSDWGLNSVVAAQNSALSSRRDPTFMAGETIRQHKPASGSPPGKSGKMCSNCIYILGGALVLYLILSRR